MLRIILVIDDYNELVYLQTLLKKLGFDVEGMQNQKKFEDTSLGFNPQILIATARGKKVNGIQLAMDLKRPRGIPKVLLLKGAGQSVSDEDIEAAAVDKVLDSPVNLRKLLNTLADLGNMDPAALLDKYSKIKGLLGGGSEEDDISSLKIDEDMTDPDAAADKDLAALRSDLGLPEEEEPVKVEASSEELGENAFIVKGSRVTPEEREKRFQKFIEKQEPIEPGKAFISSRIKDFNKKIRAQDSEEDLESLDESRQDFVKALFKKS